MNGNIPSKETVARLREQYPEGTRVELISMEDPHTTLRPGNKGRVSMVDDTGTYGKLADMKSYARNACNSP